MKEQRYIKITFNVFVCVSYLQYRKISSGIGLDCRIVKNMRCKKWKEEEGNVYRISY